MFIVTLSSPSYAKWTKVGADTMGNTFYVDVERIRKVDGYIYYWILNDYLKPISGGFLSGKTYIQGDCKLFRFKYLSWSFHKEPMGGGIGKNIEPQGNWKYPPPNSASETTLSLVCGLKK